MPYTIVNHRSLKNPILHDVGQLPFLPTDEDNSSKHPDVKIYDGSWTECSNMINNPREIINKNEKTKIFCLDIFDCVKSRNSRILNFTVVNCPI